MAMITSLSLVVVGLVVLIFTVLYTGWMGKRCINLSGRAGTVREPVSLHRNFYKSSIWPGLSVLSILKWSYIQRY